MDDCQKRLQCWLPRKPDMAVTTVTRSGWGYKLVRMESISDWPEESRASMKLSREVILSLLWFCRNVGVKALWWQSLKSKRWAHTRGRELRFLSGCAEPNSWGDPTGLRRKDERPININLPPRPPFQALKYLIVLGQLCCFVGPSQWIPSTRPLLFLLNEGLVQWHHTARGTGVSKEFRDFSTTGSSRLTEPVYCVLLEKGIYPEFSPQS